ncbi:hypothetical protein BDV96DRAFT_583919 [Lophiotrema nucula]|uniref:USP domain-containing protein n=1 Tax=Lophiotrema nucula TaxID=690887 RepID=A0A6A5YW77_9PLEO|nr:hypothetical protein BDV96DRAFT_583919 [Lophiotrema nucula]
MNNDNDDTATTASKKRNRPPQDDEDDMMDSDMDDDFRPFKATKLDNSNSAEAPDKEVLALLKTNPTLKPLKKLIHIYNSYPIKATNNTNDIREREVREAKLKIAFENIMAGAESQEASTVDKSALSAIAWLVHSHYCHTMGPESKARSRELHKSIVGSQRRLVESFHLQHTFETICYNCQLTTMAPLDDKLTGEVPIIDAMRHRLEAGEATSTLEQLLADQVFRFQTTFICGKCGIQEGGRTWRGIESAPETLTFGFTHNSAASPEEAAHGIYLPRNLDFGDYVFDPASAAHYRLTAVIKRIVQEHDHDGFVVYVGASDGVWWRCDAEGLPKKVANVEEIQGKEAGPTFAAFYTKVAN